MIRWGLAMLRNCTAARYASTRRAWCGWPNTAATACAPCAPRPASPTTSERAARCSCFARRSSSTAAPATSPSCGESGVAFELLDRAGCIRHEPALARVQEKFVGGLLLPGDETGDCHQVHPAPRRAGRGSAASTSASGRRSARSAARGDRITGVTTDGGVVAADAYLVALGSYSPLLLAPIGIRIPVYPVKGYSITVPIIDAAGAPESTVMDETHKVAVTRLGDRIRVGGTAELAGYTLQPARGAPAARSRMSSTISSRAAATSRAPSSGAACGR